MGHIVLFVTRFLGKKRKISRFGWMERFYINVLKTTNSRISLKAKLSEGSLAAILALSNWQSRCTQPTISSG
jgi:hypothetical protein